MSGKATGHAAAQAGGRIQFHYIAMLAVSALAGLAFVLSELPRQHLNPYAQFLVDYSFGFTRRALAGEIFSYPFPQIAQLHVNLIGFVAILIALVLYLKLLSRDFGLTRVHLPFIALALGSPLLFKAFIWHIGYFDIYGFIVACAALLLPVRALYPAAITAACIVLVLTHHLHILLYVPLIGAIALLRYIIIPRRYGRGAFLYAAFCALSVLAGLLAIMMWGAPSATPAELLQHMQHRALDRFNDESVGMWYRTIGEEMARTYRRIDDNAVLLPVFLLILALHLPLVKFFRDNVGALAEPSHRRLAWCAAALITLGYAAICVLVFDYNRWLGNWAACMLLLLHTIRLLPHAPGAIPVIAAERNLTLCLGWLLTLDFLGGPGFPGIPGVLLGR